MKTAYISLGFDIFFLHFLYHMLTHLLETMNNSKRQILRLG